MEIFVCVLEKRQEIDGHGKDECDHKLDNHIDFGIVLSKLSGVLEKHICRACGFFFTEIDGCRLYGDPHYDTFDRLHHHSRVATTGYLVTDCQEAELPFTISAAMKGKVALCGICQPNTIKSQTITIKKTCKLTN